METKHKKHRLLVLPVYCMAVGTMGFYLDITYSVHTEHELHILVSAAIFAVSLFMGRYVFRSLPRKTLFYSASMAAVFQMAITALELTNPDLLGTLGIALLLYPAGWYRVIIRLLVQMGIGGELSWLLAALSPYLFVLSGKRGADFHQED